MKKYLGKYEITYKKVIIFAIIDGVITGLLNEIKFLNNTSFQDPAIYLDVWFIFAIFIIINCKNYKDAAIKTFLFFLISQPLVFLVEAPFENEGLGVFRHYTYWFYITILTLPGAAIAYLIKKQNIVSVLVLSVATCYLAYQGTYYLKSVIFNFPYHLISFVFCLVMSFVLIKLLIENKKYRLFGYSLIIVALIISSLIFNIFKKSDIQTIDLGQGNWTYTVDSDVVEVSIDENNIMTIESKNNGNAYVCVTSENQILEYYINVNGNEMFISKVE